MAARTRLALVSVIILVGCVFAIPHFRHPMGDVADSDSKTDAEKDVTDLTLKITTDDETPDKKTAEPFALRDVDSLKKHSVLVQHAVAEPTSVKEEESKFPPLTSFDAANSAANSAAAEMRSLEPVPANSGETGTRQVALKPIRLMGDSIGQRLKPADFERSAGRSVTTERFNSSNNGPLTKLSPQPLLRTGEAAQNRVTSQRTLKPNTQQTDDEANWHRVVNGDTLEKLSQQYYGSPQKALMIFEANRQALFNPAILPIGLDLKIPQLDAARPSDQITANNLSAGLRPLTPQPVRPISFP